MLDKIAALFGGAASKTESAPSEEDAQRSAVAALLVEAARADADYTDDEKAIVERVLAGRFSLSPQAASALREEGERLQAGAVDLHQFTKTVKELGADDKIAFIESLWEIVMSDGARDSYEDALMRRLCGLLYVDDQTSGEARLRVIERLK